MKLLSIPLPSHEAIVAALVLCDLIGNDNLAVVMARGVSGDYEDFTGLSLDDYDLTEITDDDGWFSDYEEPSLWITIPVGGAR